MKQCTLTFCKSLFDDYFLMRCIENNIFFVVKSLPEHPQENIEIVHADGNSFEYIDTLLNFQIMFN